MKRYFLILFLVIFVSIVQAETFDEFIARLNALPENSRTAVVDSFMQTISKFPYIEGDTTVHFIYRGTASSVSVAGDFNSWSSSKDYLQKVSGTNFWYITKTFESDARLDYKFVMNGSNWILDPLNPNVCPGGYGNNSELSMPAYIQPPEIQYYSSIPHGTIVDTIFYSSNLDNSRKVQVYLPPGYSADTTHYPTVVFHDGQEYIAFAKANNILDYLIYHNKIIPIIGVFVPPINRSDEYAFSLQDKFVAFIVDELIPFIDSKYRTLNNPSYRATMGVSYGGNISIYIGVKRPEVFGLVIGQSSSVKSNVYNALVNSSGLNLKFYLDAGTYEPSIHQSLINDLIPALNSKGYPYNYAIYHEGHSWGSWRAHADIALEYMFPGSAVSVSEKIEPLLSHQFSLKQNYPNPFNPTTSIEFSLPTQSFVSLKIYNILGEEVKTLVSDRLNAGIYRYDWEAKNLPSGVYVYRLKAEKFVDTKKMVLIR